MSVRLLEKERLHLHVDMSIKHPFSLSADSYLYGQLCL